MNSYDALLSIHFLVKCRNINDTALEIKSLICTVFSMFNIVLPWVPETFLARFPVSVASVGLRPNTENSRRTREKPLVPRVTLSWQTLIIFRIYFIDTKLDFVSFDVKNLQRRCTFAGERDFPIQNSYMAGPPNDNFRKISVHKTICDLEFSEHLL